MYLDYIDENAPAPVTPLVSPRLSQHRLRRPAPQGETGRRPAAPTLEINIEKEECGIHFVDG